MHKSHCDIPHERHLRSSRSLGVALLLLLSAIGCSNDPSGPTRALNPLWSVTLNHHRITLSKVAPYNTIQLVPTVRDSKGDIFSDATIRYLVGDESIEVDSTGLVTALEMQNMVRVLVSAQYGNVTVFDTAFINITNEAHPPTSAKIVLSLDQDSAIFRSGISFPFMKQFQATVLDADNQGIDGALFRFWSSDTLRVTIDQDGYSMMGNLRSPGIVMIHAEGTVYGIAVHDSMAVQVKEPSDVFLSVELVPGADGKTLIGKFVPDSVNVGVGGALIWQNNTAKDIDIVFDDSTAVEEWWFLPTGSGNISAFKADSTGDWASGMRTRQFPHAGVYTYHSTLYGTKGKIVVR